MMVEEKDTMQTRGLRRVTDTPDGSMSDIPPSWGGVMAMLLRKIIIDDYDGKNVEGVAQEIDERLSYTMMDALLREALTSFNGGEIDPRELTLEVGRIAKEFSRDEVTIKTLGNFLNMLNPDWVNISVTINRKSKTNKSYTVHIGGIGNSMYTPVKQDSDFNKRMGIEEVPCPPPTIEKVTRKEKKTNSRKKKGKSNETD